MGNKRAEGYVSTCIMIFVYCILIAVFLTFVTSLNIVRITKRNTYKVIDSYVTVKSVEAFNSIKVGTDTIEYLDTEAFRDYFCEYNGLESNDSELISKTADGKEKFRITGFDFNFIEEKNLKVRIRYIMNIPVGFGDFRIIIVKIPVTVQTKLTEKF